MRSGAAHCLREGSDSAEEARAAAGRLHVDGGGLVRGGGAGGAARLPWCFFDESLPRNGGAEDVDICLRGSVYDPAAPSSPMHVAAVTPEAFFVYEEPTPDWVRPVATSKLVGAPLALTYHQLWSMRGMLMRGLRWGYAGTLIALKHPQLVRPRPLCPVECMLVATPLAALCAVAIGGRVWRALLVSTLVVLLDATWCVAMRLQRRLAMAGYYPPHLRLTLDEPALSAWCGDSRAARRFALLLLHIGPIQWLSFCFQIGETYAKLEWPWSAAKLHLFGRSWDFSFGDTEPIPPKLRRIGASDAHIAIVSAVALAALLEWAFTADEPLAQLARAGVRVRDGVRNALAAV